MSSLLHLWLPILLSAVVVFVISSLVHMVFKWHAFDYRGFKNDEAVRQALGAEKADTGIKYVVPFCADMKEMNSPEMQRKYAEGPNAVIIFGPKGQPNMGKHLGLWFVWTLVVAAVTAWLASKVFGVGTAPLLGVAKFAAVVTFIAHGFGTVTESIWMYRSWRSTATYFLDAACYAAGTAAVFYYTWPK